MEKVFDLLRSKSSKPSLYTPFQERVAVAASRPHDPEVILQCVVEYIDTFSSMSQEELLEIPKIVKKDIYIMLTFVIPFFCELVKKNEDSELIFQCIASASIYIPKKSNMTDLLSTLLFTLISQNASSIINRNEDKTRYLLNNTLQNKAFVDYVTKDDVLVRIYSVGIQFPIVYDFLASAISKTTSKNFKIILNSIISTIEIAPAAALTFIGALYVKLGKCLAFESLFKSFNDKVIDAGNCTFYEQILNVNTEKPELVKQSFSSLCSRAPGSLARPLLLFIQHHKGFEPALISLCSSVKHMDVQDQDLLLQVSLALKFQEEVILALLPPWVTEVNCLSLAAFVTENVNSDLALTILIQLLDGDSKTSELCAAFDQTPGFESLLMALIRKIDDYQYISVFFNKLVLVAVSGHQKALGTLVGLCRSVEPITYVEDLINRMGDLITVEGFSDVLSDLISDSKDLRKQLMKTDFISFCVTQRLLDPLACLVSDGPNKKVDKIVSDLFEGTLSELDEQPLKKLAFGVRQSSNEHGAIRIPTLIPRLSGATFTSLFDRYEAGKFLIGENLIGVESPLLRTLGVQYLSKEIASELIGRPKLLLDLTSPAFPHRPVFQFQSGQPESMMEFGHVSEIEFTFRVDEFEKPFTLFEFNGMMFVFDNSSLVCQDKRVSVCTRKWHTVCAITREGYLDVIINRVTVFHNKIERRTQLVIGSKAPPGSTFYLKKRITLPGDSQESLSYNPGPGILNVNYEGFAVQAPFVNAIPRILKKLLEETDPESFETYIQVLLNVESFEMVSLDTNHFLGFLRVIMCERCQLVSPTVIGLVLSFCYAENTIKWPIFKRLFMDYRLWIRCFSSMGPVIDSLSYLYETTPPKFEETEHTSLLHFLLDIPLFCGKTSESLENLIVKVATVHQQSWTALSIHILNRAPTPIVMKLVEAIPNALKSLPFEYVGQLSDELCLRYLVGFSDRCCSTVKGFDQAKIDGMIPVLSKYVGDERLWISVFGLLTKTQFVRIQMYQNARLVRPSMIHSICVLICELNSDQSEMRDLVINVLYSIVDANQAPLYDNIKDIQLLLHLGMTADKYSGLPVVFDTFEQCRAPSADDERVIVTKSKESSQQKLKISASNILTGTDLFFGIPSRPFIEKCNAILEKKIESMTVAINPIIENESPKQLTEIMESPSHGSVVEMAARALGSAPSGAMPQALKDMLIFGADIDSSMTVALHQETTIRFLETAPATVDTLNFLVTMVSVGWWEGSLGTLFDAVCDSFSRAPIDGDEKWDSFALLIKTILALVVDFGAINISRHAQILFADKLLGNRDYILFVMHVMRSDGFMRREDEAHLAWSALHEAVVDKTDDVLGRSFVNVFREPGEYGRKLAGIISESAHFTSPKLEQMETVQRLFEFMRDVYDMFVFESSSKQQTRNAEVRGFRCEATGESELAKAARYQEALSLAEQNDSLLRVIEKFSFEARFAICSHEDERSAFHLFSILPGDVVSKFQLCPTVHPLSVPLLYVPLSSRIDPTRYKEYSKYDTEYVVVGEERVQMSKITPAIPKWASMPFHESALLLAGTLFAFSFSHYGRPKSATSVFLAYGTTRIECALVEADRGYYIIVESTVNSNGQIELLSQSENLAVITFLDSIAFRYYGGASLFEGHPVLFVSSKHVMNIIGRSFCHEPTAIELWFSRGYSLYIIFKNEKTRNEFKAKFGRHLEYFPPSRSFFGPSFSNRICRLDTREDFSKVIDEWEHGVISTLTYLSVLNFLADRSFSCFSQYPVFPWVIHRDMTKPMGMQDEERGQTFVETYESSAPDYHFYGSHYSSAAVVMHFLMRIQPFSNLHFELNNGFDHKDRLFSDIDYEWQSSSKLSSHNVEELVPELFLLPEALQNPNRLPIPANSRDRPQDDVVLPTQYKNVVDFVWAHRRELEECENVEKWIDLIFGSKSRGDGAVASMNLFYPTTYGIRSMMVEDNDDAFEQMKRSFGQTPTQLFKEDHPPRDMVTFKRPIVLWSADQIYSQVISVVTNISKDITVVLPSNKYTAKSVLDHYTELSHCSTLSFSDGAVTWTGLEVSELSAASFSIEKLLFCGIFRSGAMQIQRAECKESGQIISYYPLVSCAPPPNLSHEERAFDTCAVSSHHFVAAEASGRSLFCFHVGTGRFIREITSSHRINKILIDDSFGCFYLVGDLSIEVYTLNGTFVASCECESPIVASSISCNDVEVFAATAHSDNRIRFWVTRAESAMLENVKTVECRAEGVVAIELIHGGSALVSIGRGNVGEVFVAAGTGKGVVAAETAQQCAGCQSHDKELALCTSCGLFYCQKCLVGGNICQRCMEKIEEVNDDAFNYV